ncbi:MAG TPA: hypothetical protein VJ725_00440 [Thermoanaerobaculia bacterium]|nr:hypothetical protein [Thermoanaerobaculia bacterium]
MLSQRYSRWIGIIGGLALIVTGSGRPVQAWAEPTNSTSTVDSQQKEASKKTKITALDRTQAVRGARLTFSTEGTDWPSNPEDIQVLLDGTVAGTAASIDSQGFDFIVPGCSPSYVPLGPHQVEVKIGNPPVSVGMAAGARQLEILPRNGGTAPKITGAFPVPTYPNPKGKTKRYDNLRIQGEGLAQDACDNEVILGSERVEICWEGTGCSSGITGKLVAAGHTIQLSNISPLDHELDNLKIRVGTQESEPVNMRLSRISRDAPIRLSLLLGLLVFAAVVVLGGRRNSQTIGRKNYGLISRIFIDAETETYSLSKFQFFLWTLVAVLAYLYLAISTWLVQGKLDFLEVPKGLPAIVLISAATTAIAQWTQSTKGPKGAGGLYPTMSDFVSVGGVVVPERFQFFLWTLLGAGIFLFLSFLRDPGTISELPEVPPGFLELMGISSIGYLGGKLARKPGPVIDQISPADRTVAGFLILTLTGRCLSTAATFRIRSVQNGQETTPEEIPANFVTVTPKKPEEPGMDPTLVKELELKIQLPNPTPAWANGKAELTLVNPDGQFATLTFQ